ncbi:unnamed protein product [Urochloa decumbens]|uniref:Aminotransferase-like plant mobile domain-containing protein n=1 Tax=Urochloa decumbens TaxID=240449 RepID=A0ABC8ZZH3_9POAL
MARKMAHHPRYPLLEMFYDEQHRGKKLEERTQVLRPLRIRTHNPLAWDDRYASYLKRAGFIALAMLVKDGLPNMDNAALTALIDRWRPEMHTFHLPAGEMTVTLQDVAMLFGLRIDGRINPAGWRDMVEALLGVRPADPPEDAKDRKTTGVHSSWLSQHFGTPPPPDADEAVVERIDRRKQRGAKDWALKHQGHVNAWNARAGNLVYGGAMHRDGPYQAYLDWLKANTRLKLKVAMDAQHIEDLPSDPEDVFDEYNDLTRTGTQPQRGPLEDYIGLQIGRFANESQQALSVPIGDPDEASRLRAYLQVGYSQQALSFI